MPKNTLSICAPSVGKSRPSRTILGKPAITATSLVKNSAGEVTALFIFAPIRSLTAVNGAEPKEDSASPEVPSSDERPDSPESRFTMYGLTKLLSVKRSTKSSTIEVVVSSVCSTLIPTGSDFSVPRTLLY